MSDDKTFTKADVDAAIRAAVQEAEDGLRAKRDELLDEVKELKAALRKTQDIKPEDFAALENENDRLKAELTKAQKEAKDFAKQAEQAAKALETETTAARSYALEAEIASAIAAGNVTPALVPAFKALVQQQAKADLVDGKYAVMIGDKPAKDYITSFLDSDEGKHFRAAPINGGGGAPGGAAGGTGGKTLTRAQFDALSHPERATFSKDGGKVVDQAA